MRNAHQHVWITLTVLLQVSLGSPGNAQEPPAADRATLDRLASGKPRIVDLTYPLNAESAFWPGPNYEPFQL